MAEMTAAAPGAPRQRALVIVFMALVAGPLFAVALISTRLFVPGGTILEVEMKSTGGTAAQIFWSPDWIFSAEESHVVPLHLQPGEFERLQLPPAAAAAPLHPLRSAERSRRGPDPEHAGP